MKLFKSVTVFVIFYLLVLSIGFVEYMTIDLNQWDRSDRISFQFLGILAGLVAMLTYDSKIIKKF